MAHVNHFLNEVGLRNRRKFKESIIATRVAGADEKHFTRYMNHLKQQERVVTQTQKGRRFMTYEETLKLESQQHVRFNQMSVDEQARLNAERDSLWSQIPAHIQAKSRKLAGR